MIRNAAKLAMAAAFVASAATLSFGQTGSWLIDSAHSTASLSLVSSRSATRPFNIAITMLAGAMVLDDRDTGHPSLRLSIYPATRIQACSIAMAAFATVAWQRSRDTLS